MPLHLLKLCVGAESISDLEGWIKQRLAAQKKLGQTPEQFHTTRMVPKRADEIVDGGSLYWVIKGQIAVRQKLLELRSVVRGGMPHCGIVYDAKLVPVARRMHRPFQGWRYLKPEDAPPDVRGGKGGDGLPEALKAELVSLGLL